MVRPSSSDAPRAPDVAGVAGNGARAKVEESPLFGIRWPRVIAEPLWFYKRYQVDRLSQMAASLAYRTLLGIVPVLVVATVVARGLMAGDFPVFVGNVISMLGLQDIQVMSDGQPTALGEWIKGLVSQAGQVNLATLGWVGVGVVVFTAIWLVAGIEDSLNQIARSSQSRAWTRRIVLYWFLLTAGPLLLAAIPIVTNTLNSWSGNLPQWGWFLAVTRSLFAAGVTWLLLWVIYTVVPTTELRSRDLALGAGAAAVLIELGRKFLSAYVTHVFSQGGVYSSLGVAPVFMLWLYFMWLFVLLGVALATHVDAIRRGLARA